MKLLSEFIESPHTNVHNTHDLGSETAPSMGLKQQIGQGVRFDRHTLMTDSWERNFLSLSFSCSSCGLCLSLCSSQLQHDQWVELISLNMKELPVNWGKKEGVRKRGEERLLKVGVHVCVNGYAAHKSQHASPESCENFE